MIIPNFFIVGAPKCGTTSLSEYLRSHPSVFMSALKEPHFFCDDYSLGQYLTKDRYLKDCFGEVKSYHKAIGEASATYLSSITAINNIFRFNPNAKIIVMLRNPVDMIESYHAELLRSGRENVQDLKKAWDLEENRVKEGSVPHLVALTPNCFAIPK